MLFIIKYFFVVNFEFFRLWLEFVLCVTKQGLRNEGGNSIVNVKF